MIHMKKITIVFAGGGTGGHIYPGLAIADELRNLFNNQNREVKIIWFGNNTGMDKDIVTKSGSVDAFYGIPSGKLRRYFSIKNFVDLFKIFAGLVCSYFLLLKLKPAIVFSKGGFVSVTPCAAAHFLRIPVYTHECDFTPGLATRINSRFASKILLSYEDTKKYIAKKLQTKTVVTGNPIRPVFYTADGEKGRNFLFTGKDADLSKPVLLVLGGSLGAHQINELIIKNIDFLTENFVVVHQCGKKDKNIIPVEHHNYYPYDFIYSEMCDVIKGCDIVLSRAGANSIWECSVAGKPLVLVPLCGEGTRGDQVDNARYFEEKRAAIVLEGKNADSERLIEALTKMKNEQFRAEFAANSKALSSGNRPALKIAQLIYESL